MDSRNRLLPRLLLAATLTAGIGIVWGCGVVWMKELVFPTTLWASPDLNVSTDGVLVERIYDASRFKWQYFTLDGQKLSDEQLNESPIAAKAIFSSLAKSRISGFGNQWQYATRPFTTQKSPLTNWFLLPRGADDRRAIFVGFDSISRRKLGYLGRNGFSTDEPPVADQFVAPASVFTNFQTISRGTLYLTAADGLYSIHLDGRTTSLVVRSAGLEAGMVQVVTTEPKLPEFILVRSPRGLVEIAEPNAQARWISLPAELLDKDLTVCQLKDQKLLVATVEIGKKLDVHRLYWLDPNGNVERRETLELAGSQSFQTQFLPPAEMTWIAAAMPVPAMWGIIVIAQLPWHSPDPSIRGALWDSIVGIGITVAILVVFSALVGTLCLRRQRQFGEKQGWIWFVFVLLFGLPALIGYLVHRRWPPRDECAACGQLTRLDRPACIHCAELVHRPTLAGNEVFL